MGRVVRTSQVQIPQKNLVITQSQCCQVGINKVIAAVKGLTSHMENREAYLSSNMNMHLKGLLCVSISII